MAQIAPEDEVAHHALTQRELAAGNRSAALRWYAKLRDALQQGISPDAQMQALYKRCTAAVLLPLANRYRFRHHLAQQALVDQLPPHRHLKMHWRIAARLAGLGGPPTGIARFWLEAGQPREAIPWLLAAAREAAHLAAFSDVLRDPEPFLVSQRHHAEGLRLRDGSLDALDEPAELAAYHAAADVADETESHNLRAKAALAQVKLGDPKGALTALAGLAPSSIEGRPSEALAYSGAAALGVGDPAIGTAKAAVTRRLALQSEDTTSLVISSWAQAAAAHARGELHRSVWADLHENSHVPHLALRVFDDHLCTTQCFLHGARPYADVISFAQALSNEAQRLGAACGHAFGVTLRGEAE